MRQLKNITEQISILCRERQITAQILSQFIPEDQESTQLATIKPLSTTDHSFENEREILYKILFELRSNVNELRNEVGMLKKQLQTGVTTTAENKSLYIPTTNQNTDINEAEEAEAEEYVEPQKEHYTDTNISTDSLNLNEIGKQMLIKALERNGGNRRKAAEELGISDRTLYRRLRQFGLE